jgi:hypothetical protein
MFISAFKKRVSSMDGFATTLKKEAYKHTYK